VAVPKPGGTGQAAGDRVGDRRSAFAEVAFGAQIVKGDGFQNLEVWEAAHLGDEHLGEAVAHRRLPVSNTGGFGLGDTDGWGFFVGGLALQGADSNRQKEGSRRNKSCDFHGLILV